MVIIMDASASDIQAIDVDGEFVFKDVANLKLYYCI